MKISRADAVALCTGLGFKTAGKWNKQRMIVKLNDVIQMVNDGGGIEVEEDTPDAERLNKLLLALSKSKDELILVAKDVEEDGTGSVESEDQAIAELAEEKPAKKSRKKSEPRVEEEEEEEEVEEKPVKKAKKEKSEKMNAVKKETGQDSGEKNKDKFGYKKGTKVSVFLSCLSKKFKTVGQLCSEAETKQQCGAFPELIRRGLVVKEGNTYRMV